MDKSLITWSLETAGERCPDPTPLVYGRLFARRPDLEPLFVRDTEGLVRGEMLSRVIEAVLDFIDRRRYAHNLIQCEVVTHEGYGVPREAFGLFFDVLAETLAEILAEDWTAPVAAAWAELIEQLDWYVAHPVQAA